MSLINLRDVTVSFGGHPLLDKINFAVEDKERICILGRNGTGKSTLLRLLNGEIKVDGGELSRQQGLVLAKLEQDVPDGIAGSVYDVVAQGLGSRGKLLCDYQHLNQQMGETPSEQQLEELQRLIHELDQQQAWNLSHKIDAVISRLGLPADQDFSALSGGLKRRVLLGQAIVKEPQILMLDEPTNHLDIEAIDWLENYLLEFIGTVIFITHDRAFLQRLATRMLEIDRGQVQSYPGNYQQYLIRKQQELETEQVHQQLFDKKLAQEEMWIRQGIKARRTRNEGRVRALKALREERNARRNVMGKASMQIQQAENSGKIVIEAENIDYCYESKTLIKDFSTVIMRGDKIGVIGPNGVGKTTLLKILLGELAPQQGQIKLGTKLEVAYFDQLRVQLDEEKTVADNVSYGDQFVTIGGRAVQIIGYLQDFLFSPDRARSPVKSLSGGERNRLLLARLFSKPANVLVMDEPTNDLDLETLELLEELLVNFEGTLLLVSHDRSFLDHVVTSTIVFEGNGAIQEYVGGYEDWLRQRPPTKAHITPSTTTAAKPIPTTVKPAVQPNSKELRNLESKIEKLEATQKTLQEQLNDPALYEVTQKQKLQVLQQQLKQVETELAAALEKWEQLI